MTLLRELGWQVTATDQREPMITAGSPCQRASLVDAQAHHDLRVQLPRYYDVAQREQLAAELLQQPASLCAYLFKLGDATRAATARLQANDGYRFTAVQMGWIGFGMRGANAQGWQRFRSFGRGYAPNGSNSRALDAFYSGQVRSECGVGRQVAQLATQRELYGDALFDREFTAGELSIGTFLTLHDTQSILLGSRAGEFFADGKAVRTAALGRQAFMAAPGFIEHVFDKRFLDDINNQAENFVITDISQDAAEALARHGGFAHYDALNRQIWELSRQLPDRGGRHFERLLHERDRELRVQLSPQQQATLAQIDALLADPVYRQLQIYVHDKGVRPLGYHIVRLLDRNPRTPFSIDLALHNLHTTLFRRWLDARLRDCANTVTHTTHGDGTWNLA
ncbi:hypothetical protein [Stenotrophomonas sp. SY1]|uniref:hypothetical protein n=1 Tax=Stenotrophomonas sp. SY1 TaxID=477235 RepID=UPI001E498E8E|nr:hypothetical protein [Stenotrophomonas sp. SY1]MCD9088206.1 hypothetical protein [Stenotrophomonas sp. SY1]